MKRSAGSAQPLQKLLKNGDFRSRLQAEFVRRCNLNPRYSLRAFAKFLQIDPSTLSQLLRLKRSITVALIKKLGERLCLSPAEMEAYFPPKGYRRYQKTVASNEQRPVRDLTTEVYQLIADWYHYAILELVTVRGFKQSSRWIAKKLKISSTEAQIAVERLIKLEMILVSPDGKWSLGSPMISTVSNPFTDAALRKVQAQILDKSKVALEELPLGLRDHSGMCMAINTRRIPKAKEMIKKFRRELCEYLQQDADRNAVYQLGVSFYPLTSQENGEHS